MTEWKKKIISPSEYQILIFALAEKIKKTGREFTGVYGIPRGGLVLAVYLSHHLDIPLVTDPASVLLIDGLVVDDLVDTGKTLKSYSEAFFTATLHYKPRSIVIPDIYVMEVPDSDWIVYPYEQVNEEPNREPPNEPA